MPDDSPGGYHGRYLRIDLAASRAESLPLAPAVLRRYLGGSGLGVYLLLVEGRADVDALAPEAPIAFVFSPLVGSPLTTSAKFAVVSKSPLTNRINDSLASSRFAIAGKRTGHDAILIVGRADEPSIAIIDDGAFRLESAADLWGKDVDVTERQLRQRFPGDFDFAVIGPAGENCVRYATISHDGRHAGRGGSGAVLGAKNIKAIVVRGNQRCEWAHSEKLAVYARELSQRSLGPATAKYRELGTAANLLVFNRLGTLPTRNFQQSSFEGAEQLAPETLAETHPRTRASCAACTIGCEHIYALSTESGPAKTSGVRLEYESLFALGPLCGIDQPAAVLRAAQRCDQLGLDTISLGGTLAFAMECVERSWLSVDGLTFGNARVLLPWIERIAYRDGFGDPLADGSRQLAERLGGDAMTIAPQVKGLELPGYEPRVLQTLALGFAVGTRGADHNRSSAYEIDLSPDASPGKITTENIERAIQAEDRSALMDSLILCRFLRGVFTDLFSEAAGMLRMVTGWEVTDAELCATARRIIDVKKQFNVLAGWTPAEDTLPARFFESSPNDDPSTRLNREHLQQAIRHYNRERGWTDDGWPNARSTPIS